MKTDKNIQAFFALVRAGLWADIGFVYSWKHGITETVDWEKVYQLAEKQSVIGLVAAGIDNITDLKISRKNVLQFVGSALQLEQQNTAMNEFVARLITFLRNKDVYALLVKGQGIAQCYERPLWRASGDVDLLLSDTNYEKAKSVLLPKAINVEQEYKAFKHQGMTMDCGYVVELHGTLHSRLSKRIDKGIDEAQRDVFFAGSVRSEEFKDSKGSRVQVFLPSPDNDVIFVFTHILHHFYIEGIGLRQICDWCRLLWKYRSELDLQLLESRIKRMGLMSEWKAFGALAVDYLGMPVEAMPMFGSSVQEFKGKAERIMEFVLECGNFGHNREKAGGKIHSAWMKMKDFTRHAIVFPLDSVKFLCHFLIDGVKLALAK